MKEEKILIRSSYEIYTLGLLIRLKSMDYSNVHVRSEMMKTEAFLLNFQPNIAILLGGYENIPLLNKLAGRKGASLNTKFIIVHNNVDEPPNQ